MNTPNEEYSDTPLRINLAIEADLISILALYSKLHPEDEPLDLPSARSTWWSILATTNRSVLIARLHDLVVGTAEYQVVSNLTRQGRPFILVENLVVHAPYRRNGVGAALLKDIARRVRASQPYKIQLCVAIDGPIGFYEQQGFEADGVAMKIRLLPPDHVTSR